MFIKIVSWNCQSIRNKQYELNNLLNTKVIHIVALQETWLNTSNTISFRDYNLVRKDRDSQSRNPHGGVAFLVRKDLKIKIITPTNPQFIESLFILVQAEAFSFTLGSIYSSSSLKRYEAKADIIKLLSIRGPFALMGDWNAKHEHWNNFKSNLKGKDLHDIASNNLCDIHFPELPTLMPDNKKGELSIIDFVVSKNLIAITKPKVILDMSSDHRPIEFTIRAETAIPAEFKIKNYKKTDWKAFRHFVEDDCNEHSGSQSHVICPKIEIDEEIDLISSIIKSAVDKSVPNCSPNKFRYPFSREIKNLIKTRSHIRKCMKNLDLPHCRRKINEISREIKLLTLKMKSESWQDKIRTLKVDDLSLYQFTKKIKKKFSDISPLRNNQDELVFSDSDKAEVVAKTFSDSHKISDVPTIHSEKIKCSLDLLHNSSVDFPHYERIRDTELKTLTEMLKPRKAAGYDEISNVALKNLPEIMLSRIKSVMNKCLGIGYFPRSWKVGKVVAIPKPGKDLSQASSYRPITLESCLGKLLEKVILDRMTDFCETKKIIIDQQFGFRANHSCPQQVMRIIDVASSRFNEDETTGVVFLDIAKAFDRVWHEALIHKLLVTNLPTYMIKIIESFLSDRVSYVQIGKASSERYAVNAGVPQGSPLSPLLFNIFNNDIPKPRGCKLFVFADDAAVTRSQKNLSRSKNNFGITELVKNLENGLNEIKKHYDGWKVTINPLKTEAILLTKSTRMLREQHEHKISFCGSLIEWKSSAKYLGVVLDNKLLFKQNIDINISKAKKVMATLYGMLKKNSGVHEFEKITLYRSYIRPILTYACPIFSHAAKTHLNKLQVLQNKCLRMVLNARYRTRISTLHRRSKIPTISSFISKLSKSFYENSAKSSNRLIKSLGHRHKSISKAKIRHRMPISFF